MQAPSSLTIRELPKSKKTTVDELHPMFKVQKNKFSLEEEQRLGETGMIYGSAVPMMLRHERQVLSEPERMPGLRSSFLSLECSLGRLNKMEFEDVFNRNALIQGPSAHQLYMRQFN